MRKCPFTERTGCSGRTVVVNNRVDRPATPAKTDAASTGKVGELFVGRTQGDGIAGLLTVALPQEASPAGVSFRSESLSMPEKG